MALVDGQWILSAYNVLSTAQSAMHVSEIEQLIRKSNLVPEGPSMPLEVLLTKEAAMGRKFTKPEGSAAGFFSLLPPQAPPGETQISNSPSRSVSQNGPPSPTDNALVSGQKYQHKYSQLKKTCKQMIYLNAALYDEISRLEQKIEKTSKERSMLLKKVMTDQNIVNHKEGKGTDAQPVAGVNDQANSTRDKAAKRKNLSAPSPPSKKRKASVDDAITDGTIEATGSKKSQKKLKSEESKASSCIKIPPINLDSAGRPVLPIELGAGLTIYSIGEVNDRPGYCTSSSIYPMGYCCTREYASLEDINKRCLYTCKITEGDTGPKFEISPDSGERTVLLDGTPEDCHNQLIQLIRQNSGDDLKISSESDFFGLKHPVIRNLLQCSQGANNCLEYQWCMFEVVKNTNKVMPVKSESDPATSYEALMKHLKTSAAPDTTTNLTVD